MQPKKKPARRDAGRPRGAFIEQTVLAHTLAELAESGLENLSVERIAHAADVNKTSIYRRWPTREELVVAALGHSASAMETALPDTGSLRGDLLGLLDQVAQFASQPLGRALARAAFAEPSQSSVPDLAAQGFAQMAAGPARTLVTRARARGEWREGARGEQVLFALAGAVLHRAMLERQPMSRRWLESLVDVVVLGVLPRPDEPPSERKRDRLAERLTCSGSLHAPSRGSRTAMRARAAQNSQGPRR